MSSHVSLRHLGVPVHAYLFVFAVGLARLGDAGYTDRGRHNSAGPPRAKNVSADDSCPVITSEVSDNNDYDRIRAGHDLSKPLEA